MDHIERVLLENDIAIMRALRTLLGGNNEPRNYITDRIELCKALLDEEVRRSILYDNNYKTKETKPYELGWINPEHIR